MSKMAADWVATTKDVRLLFDGDNFHPAVNVDGRCLKRKAFGNYQSRTKKKTFLLRSIVLDVVVGVRIANRIVRVLVEDGTFESHFVEQHRETLLKLSELEAEHGCPKLAAVEICFPGTIARLHKLTQQDWRPSEMVPEDFHVS